MADPRTLPELTGTTQQVILAMATCHDAERPYLRDFARDIDMPVEQLRRIIFGLEEQGLVTYGQLPSDNGRPAGSTYWLTERGAQLQEQLR